MNEHNQDYALESMSPAALAALALRDFFLADGRASLAEAVARLPCAQSLGVVVPDELEYEFNRLFVGPTTPVAPPYASVYLEREPRLMGETTQRIAKFYEALGLKPGIAGLPADFLGLELEAWLVLESSPGQSAHLTKAREFLWQHIKSWVPLFLLRLRTSQLSPVMANVADLLDEWLKSEKG